MTEKPLKPNGKEKILNTTREKKRYIKKKGTRKLIIAEFSSETI